MNFYYRRNSAGFPVVHSNINAESQPLSAHNWVKIATVVDAPAPRHTKFNGAYRFFIEKDPDNGFPVENTLIRRTGIPNDNKQYYELYDNDVLGLPYPHFTVSGAVDDDPADLVDIELHISPDFETNGHRNSKIN